MSARSSWGSRLDPDSRTFPLDAELLSTALSFALTYDLTIHDALFPALAARLDCELATADRVQARVTECPVRLLL